MRDQPLFKDSGFESLEEWLEHLEDMYREEAGLESLGLENLRAVAASTLDAKGARQVGLRLPGKDYSSGN